MAVGALGIQAQPLQLLEAQPQHQQHQRQGQQQPQQVGRAGHQQVAEQQAIEVHRQLQGLDQQHPQPQAAGQHGVEHRLGLAAAGRSTAHQQFGDQHGRQGAGRAPQQRGQRQGLGQHHPRQHGVGHQVGGQHPLLQHQQGAEQGAHQAA
jgi:hypothetical protein